MSEVKIKAESRTQFGKGAARRIRRTGQVPAVLYGHGSDPVHIALPGHELMLALKTSNVLLDVDLGDKSALAIPKQVQRDPIKGVLRHVDLLIVRRGEKVVVDIPVSVVGEPARGALVNLEHSTLSVEAEATHIPGEIEVSIEGLEIGTQVHASDVVLPPGTSLNTDPDALVVHVAAAPTEGQMAAAEGEETAEAAGEQAAGEESADSGGSGESGSA